MLSFLCKTGELRLSLWGMLLVMIIGADLTEAATRLRVSKEYSDTPLIQGIPFTVTYRLHNEGQE